MSEDSSFALLLASSVHDIKNSLSMLLDSLDGVVQTTPITNPQQRHQFATLRGEAARINNSLMYLLGLYRMQKMLPTLNTESSTVQCPHNIRHSDADV